MKRGSYNYGVTIRCFAVFRRTQSPEGFSAVRQIRIKRTPSAVRQKHAAALFEWIHNTPLFSQRIHFFHDVYCLLVGH